MTYAEEQIVYHQGTIDPTDFQVDDILTCIAAGQGLEMGNLYPVHAVTRQRSAVGVTTVVTVTVDHKLVQIVDAESFLRRTRVLVDVTFSEGHVTRHSFPDLEELELWCAETQVAPSQLRRRLYVAAAPVPLGGCRFTAMCVPGELDDGSDAEWYVHDLVARTSNHAGAGAAARTVALQVAREANRASPCQEEFDDA